MSNLRPTPKPTKPKKTIESFFKPKDVGSSKCDVSSTSIGDTLIIEKDVERPSKIPRVEPKGVVVTLTTTFERDPGLRTPIYKYHVNERDAVRLAYLKMGPYQLPRDWEYPLTPCGDQNRGFGGNWYSQYTWLEYSPSTDKAYCFPCFLFETNPPKRPAYTTNGFNSWKRVNGAQCSFLKHVGGMCSPHMNAVKACEDLMHSSQHIDKVLNQQSKEDVLKNRLRLKTTIECVQWLALQGCAFRGHDETVDSKNRGNFVELIKFSARCNDEVAGVVMENAPQNAMYISHSIQKEVLHIMAERVRQKIREEVGDGRFCILVDEAQDSSTKEQMAIVLRFVDDYGLVQERFFAIVGVVDIKALILKKVISDVLACYNLHIGHMRGQGYDGASNVRGAWNGLQALFLKECPCAYYVHCFAHRLQLALVDASKDTQDVWLFFSKLASIVNLVGASPKCKSELQSAQEYELAKLLASGEIETGKGANQGRNLQRSGATRWSSHFTSVNSLIEMYDATSTVLESITRTGSTNSMRGEAKGASIHMRSFEFVFILHLMRKTMGITNVLCQALQEKNQYILNVVSLVSTTKTLLQELKIGSWDIFLESVVSFCKKHDIDVPDMDSRYKSGTGRSCHQKDSITVRHRYHFDLFVTVIDHQLMELNTRFTDDTMDLFALSSAFDPGSGYKSLNINDLCTLEEKYYPNDFNMQDIYILRTQLQHYHIDVARDPRFQNLSTVFELCQKLVETRKSKIYNLVDRLIRLVLTLPVSTATMERAFSSMKLIKTLLRNKMDDDFLADLMVLHIEREYAKEIDLESVIDEFDSVPRRVHFH